MTKPPTVIIAGPTAVGKTDLSLELARYFDAPVISSDARQCYKYLDIGTGKVSGAIRAEIPHYHISTLYPDQPYSAAHFARDAEKWKQEILDRKKPVFVVGGSTLYIEALLRPLDPTPPKNEANIRKLQKITDRSGINAVQKMLLEVDPEYARRIDGPNPHRMYRALDVWMQTGKPFSSFHKKKSATLPEHTILITLHRNRAELYDRINRRVDLMLRQGLLDEVGNILDMGYDPGLQSLQTVGYRESIAYLQNELPLDQMREKIKTHTRRYAKRQLTWFRRWNEAHWFNLSDLPPKDVINRIIQMTGQLAAED